MRELGILGMNQRNGDYILPQNPRKYYPLVDDKLLTKQLANKFGIAAPKLYQVIETEHQIVNLGTLLEELTDFAIKPAHGSGGNGILIVKGRNKNKFRKLNGVLLSLEEIGYFISNILSGMYSLGGQSDKALIEYRVKFDPVFENVSYQGVPDIRTIVYKGVPAMAMLRLPTRMSDGKANLHQGAIGVAIDLATGLTRSGVWHSHIIDEHPDSGNSIVGLQIPYWQKILELCAQCKELVSMDYIGVDIVLDAQLGPLMLEINARPGLSIQVANQQGLLLVLNKIDRLEKIPVSTEARVAISQQLHINPENG